MRDQRSHGAQDTAGLLGRKLRWGLAESSVHDSCRLGLLEGGLLLLEGRLLRETSRLRSKRICKA